MTHAVRSGRPEDRAAIVALARAMHAESPLSSRVAFKEGRVVQVFTHLLTEPASRCAWVLECTDQAGTELVGFLGGVLQAYLFSFDRYVGDVGFYVLPEHRGTRGPKLLLDALDAWGRARGALEIGLGLQSEVAQTERIGRFYEYQGFRRIGGMYKRDLGVRP